MMIQKMKPKARIEISTQLQRQMLQLVLFMMLLLTTGRAAQAALLAYEPFTNAPGTAIVGTGDGFGFSTNWMPQAAANNSGTATNTDYGLRYTDANGKQLLTSGGGAGFFQGLTSGNSSMAPFRPLGFTRGTNVDGTSTWISFLIVRQGPTGTLAGNPYGRGVNMAHDFANGDTTTTTFSQRVAVGNGSGAPENTVSLLPAGGNRKGGTNTFGVATNFVVVKIEHISGANDNAYLFVNTLLGAANEPSNSSAITNELGVRDFSFDRIRMFAGGNANAAQPYGEAIVDEYRIGENYGDVAPIACVTAGIGQQPANTTVFENTAVVFNYTPTGTSASSQWQVSIDSGTTWNNIANATNTTYSYSNVPLSDGGKKFRVISSVPCDFSSITSSAAILTVNACVGAGVSTSPTNVTVAAGNVADFYVAGLGSSPSYQWQVSTDGGSTWNNVAEGVGGTTAHYTTVTAPSGYNGYKYRAIVSVACNNSFAISGVATLGVTCNSVGISSQPVDAGTIEGGTATFAVTGNGSFPTYQWQVSLDGGVGWDNVTGATNATYTTPAAIAGDNGKKYRCAVSVACNSTTTNSAAATLSIRNVSETAFRSAATGNWESPATWEWSFNGANWAIAGAAPSEANCTNITVRAGHVVTVATAATVDQTTIQSGGQVVVANGAGFTIADGAGTDVTVFGTLKSASALTTTGSLVVENGGRFTWTSANAAVIPTATWATNSTCEVAPTAAGAAAPVAATLGQTFGNFVWNWPLQNASVILGGTDPTLNTNGVLTNILGDFEITSGSAFSFSTKPDTNYTVVTTTIGGMLRVHAMSGNFSLGAGGTERGTYTFKLGKGVIVDAGGKFDLGNSGTTDGSMTLEFTGDSQYTLNNVPAANPSSGIFKVATGAKLTLNSAIAVGVTGTNRTFTVEGTLDLHGVTGNSFGELAGSGVITNSGTAVTLALGNNGVVNPVTYQGVLVGPIAVTKNGTNTVTLAGASANTYAGGTIVQSGVLSVQKDGGLGVGNVTVGSGATLQLANGAANNYLADPAELAINGSGAVELNFSGPADTIKALVLDGVAQADGVWGSAVSGAPNVAAQLIGTGTIKVQSAVVNNQPPVVGGAKVSNSNLIISGTGTPSSSYVVLTATNINLPMSSWTRLTTNQVDAGGSFAFTNTPGQARLFYRLQLP